MNARSNVLALVRDAFDLRVASRPQRDAEALDDEAGTMDEESFQVFYRRTAGPLRAYAGRVLGNLTNADDIVQESYLRLLRMPATAGQDFQRLRALVFRIASNLMVDHWRSRRREAAEADHESHEPGAPGPDIPLRVDLERVFQQLSPQQRQLMWLAYVEGAEHREIATALGLRERSVKVLLHRARRKLAGLLRAGGR